MCERKYFGNKNQEPRTKIQDPNKEGKIKNQKKSLIVECITLFLKCNELFSFLFVLLFLFFGSWILDLGF